MMAKRSSAVGHTWLNKFPPTPVISINLISSVKFSFWWERNLSIIMKGSATGLLANLWAETLPTHKAASPAYTSTFGLSYKGGM